MHEINLTRIKQYIEDQCVQKDTSLSFTDNLFDCGLDSMGVMRLTAFLESSFNVVIPEEKITYDNLKDISSIENLIKTLIG